jgi:Tol biopolymer transport system component
MNPDGTGIKTITSSGGGWPAWSPDGSHIVYSQSTKKGNTTTYNIFRVPAGGGTAVNLTADLQSTYLKLPLAWRP